MTSRQAKSRASSKMASREEETVLLRDDWELTWPIWHMLPREDRKALAREYGFAHIGDFEEFMSLQRAVNSTAEPYSNQQAYPSADLEQKKPAATESDDEDEDSVAVESDSDDDSDDDMLEEHWRVLPDAIWHTILEWLPVEAFATVAWVNTHWKHLTRTEAVYKRLCERIYLQQSKRRALKVSRFGNSYRTMLQQRPRVKVGGGLYVLKYAHVKPIQRDMWTEIPHGAILETVYYRYLCFLEGPQRRVLYALTPSPPHEMIRKFQRLLLHPHEDDPVAVWGHFQVQGNQVVVLAHQSYQTLQMELTIQTNNTSCGRFGVLSFDRHVSASDPPDLLDGFLHPYAPVFEYKVPDEDFRFLPDSRL